MRGSKNKTWLYITTLTFITALVWFGVNVYSTLHKSTIPQDVMESITPLNPNLNTKIFDQLQERTNDYNVGR